MTTDSIVLFGDDHEPVELTVEPYSVEAELEERLVRSPSLLAGSQMTPGDPRRWLLVRRQYPIRSRDGSEWNADILFLDQDGVPTIVEVKKADNRELRRSVVGQVLDYAAGLRYGSVDRIRGELEARTGAADELAAFLDELDPEDFWARVIDNVADGRIRLIIAADEIPVDVQAVVEYLNEQLRSAELFALGVVQFVSKGNRVLVPRLAGATVAARTGKAGRGVGPGFETVLSDSGDIANQATRLLEAWGADHRVTHADGPWSRKWVASDGSTLFRLYPGQNMGVLEINLKLFWDTGRAKDAQELFAGVQALAPDRKLHGDRLPTVAVADVVARWGDLEAILNRLDASFQS